MSNRLKYSLNGVYRCENFAHHVEQNDFPSVPIGSAGGMNGWYITFQTSNQHDLPVVYPFIFCHRKPTFLLRRFFRVIKKDGSSCFEKQGCFLTNARRGPLGNPMNVAELLNEENDYLDDDGALTVEYGIHVDVILGEDEIWRFNIHDRSFTSSRLNRMVELEDAWGKKWYTHRQFSPNFYWYKLQRQIYRSLDKLQVENILQVIHGVRIQLNYDDFYFILPIAHSLNLHNVIQYCDQQMIEYSCQSPIELSSFEFLEEVVDYGLRRSLVQLVKRCESWEELVKAIGTLDIEKMSGESMKTFAAKIFTRKF